MRVSCFHSHSPPLVGARLSAPLHPHETARQRSPDYLPPSPPMKLPGNVHPTVLDAVLHFRPSMCASFSFFPLFFKLFTPLSLFPLFFKLFTPLSLFPLFLPLSVPPLAPSPPPRICPRAIARCGTCACFDATLKLSLLPVLMAQNPPKKPPKNGIVVCTGGFPSRFPPPKPVACCCYLSTYPPHDE